jgi:hypothetical protein
MMRASRRDLGLALLLALVHHVAAQTVTPDWNMDNTYNPCLPMPTSVQRVRTTHRTCLMPCLIPLTGCLPSARYTVTPLCYLDLQGDRFLIGLAYWPGGTLEQW